MSRQMLPPPQERRLPSNVVETMRRRYPSRQIIETRDGRAHLPQSGECAKVGERMWPSIMDEARCR